MARASHFPFLSVLPGEGKVCSGEPRFQRAPHPRSPNPWSSGQTAPFLTGLGAGPPRCHPPTYWKPAWPFQLINRKSEDLEREGRITFQGLPLFQRTWKDSSNCTPGEGAMTSPITWQHRTEANFLPAAAFRRSWHRGLTRPPHRKSPE